MLPLGIGLILLALFVDRLGRLDLDAIRSALAAQPPGAWTVALVASALSFAAVAQYDVIAHRLLGTGVPTRQAVQSGAAATALAQVLGLGVLTGTASRWRLCQPHALTPAQAMLLTGTVTGGFLFGWAIVTALAFAALPSGPAPPALFAAVTLGAGALIALSLTCPTVRIGRWRIRVPGLLPMALLILWAALDIACAAVALWVFLPSPDLATFLLLAPAFLVALGCGMISGTPMGLGAFELTLLAMLPMMPETDLLAAVVGFRLVYYIIPGVVALAYVFAEQITERPPAPPQPQPIDLIPSTARYPVALALDPLSAMVRHEGLAVLSAEDTHWPVAVDGPHAHVALGDPFGRRDLPVALAALRNSARAALCAPAVYKATEGAAHQIAAAGWRCLPISSEAVVRPARFDLTTPAHRQLRRKLRHAHKAHVTVIARPTHRPPCATMARVAAQWARDHGGVRGFSMGQFGDNALRHQRLFCAYADGRLLGFVSFHVTQAGWMLDLLRHDSQIPDGTMHRLIVTAIDAARVEGVAEVSLDCVPFYRAAPGTALSDTILGALYARAPAARGLHQFKAAFAPEWRPRYLCAPSWVDMTLALVQLRLLLRPKSPPNAKDMRDIQQDYADYAFDA